MKLTKRLKIGNNLMEVGAEGSDLHECLMELQKVSLWDLHECGKCGSDLIRLHAYITKDGGYKYTKVICPKCKAQLTLGQAKKDGAYYYRRNDGGTLDWQSVEQKDNTKKETYEGKEIVWEDK